MNDRHTMRASDHDRQAVVDRLRGALEDGRLTMDEYLDRMQRALQAVTYGDLAPLCADLPAAAPAPLTPLPSARRGALAGLPVVLKVLWTIWLIAVSVNVVVWALVSATSGHLAYPWPLWVAGPYGAVLFAISAAVTQCRCAKPKTILLSERAVLSRFRTGGPLSGERHPSHDHRAARSGSRCHQAGPDANGPAATSRHPAQESGACPYGPHRSRKY
jgi:Domain of unknown function (DUF1707)